jgi:phage gp29-like protein
MSKRSSRRARGRALVTTGARPGAALPAELQRPIATTHDGRDITRPYTYELEEYRDQRLRGAVDWGVYDRILLDDQVKSCLEQRRSAVVSREWNVLSGNDEDPRAVAAAEALEANLKAVGWDLVTDKMLYSPFNGISVAELGWGPWQFGGRTLWGWVPSDRMRAIHVRHARRFRYDKDRKLRLITAGNVRGEVLPDRKFWVVTAGGSDDDEPYGRGLAEWLYWPCLFKRNGIRFWNIFLDKFSVPPVKGSYPRGSSQEEIDKLLGAMMSLANDAGIAVPEGVEIAFMQVATTGIDFRSMPEFMDAAIAKIILSQTMTTDDGSSLAQGKVHAGVKQELITADADLLTDSFTRGPARWFTDYNFGSDVAAPIVVRLVEEEADTKVAAETDRALAEIGWVRDEESHRAIYGEGYVREAPRRPQLSGRRPVDGGTLIPHRDPAEFAEGAGPRDIVDQALDQVMREEGWREAWSPVIAPLLEELARAGSEEEVAAILARAAELDDEAGFTEALARSAFALRMAGASESRGSGS